MSNIAKQPDSIPVDLMRKLGFEPDPWQIEVLGGSLRCSMAAG